MRILPIKTQRFFQSRSFLNFAIFCLKAPFSKYIIPSYTVNLCMVYLSGALLFLPTLINFKSLQNKAVKTIGGGSLLESPTKFFNKFSILRINDLFKMEVAKIVHSHFMNNLPSKLSKFFTLTKNISSRATRATESSHNTLYIPRYSTIRCNDALNIKELKFGIIFHQKFKIHQQDYLKTNTKNICYKIIIKIYTAVLPCFCFK